MVETFEDRAFLKDGDDVVIFDVDGTLAHMNGKRGPFEWEKVGLDDADPVVVSMFQMHRSMGDKIICMSGRDEVCRAETEIWLIRNGCRPHVLFMRPKKDNRKDAIVKREIYERDIKPRFTVRLIYDDRNQVVEMWRSLGLKVFQVADGNF